ncbi:hypothetical protein ACFQX6_50485 [Streptosporangium lutulentum]
MILIARIARSPGMLAVLAFVIVLWRIGVPSFWRDESVSVMAATMSFDELWALFGEIDTVHALYYLLLRPFASFGGSSRSGCPRRSRSPGRRSGSWPSGGGWPRRGRVCSPGWSTRCCPWSAATARRRGATL